MKNEITELFEKYGSDKISHGYTDIYFSYFEKLKNEKLNILEIGVADGKSVRAWSEFFSNSNIIGIDILTLMEIILALMLANIGLNIG